MKTKCPYTFAARSRAARVAYLLDRRGYHDGQRYPFSWNVKVYGVDWRHPKGECTLNPAYDSAWEKECEKEYVSNWAFEAAQRLFADNEWTSYPGDDQGEWEFLFLGRSGGHLTLYKWRDYSFEGLHADDLREWLAELPFAGLRLFYRAIVCADAEFTPAKARAEVEYQVNFIRGQWEEARDAEREAADAEFVEFMEAARPDMYQGVGL